MITRELVHDAARINAMVAALSVPDGGFSVDQAGADVTGGYAVAIHPECCAVLGAATVGDLLAFIVTRADALALPGRIFGGWRDPSDGRIYLDVSVLITDREHALALARHLDELAIFDFGACASIPTY